jgi:hypothetical protein
MNAKKKFITDKSPNNAFISRNNKSQAELIIKNPQKMMSGIKPRTYVATDRQK